MWDPGALGRVSPFPLCHHRLPAWQDGTGLADNCQARIRAVLVLADHMPDLAESGPCISVAGGPHIRSGWFSLTS